MSSNLRRPPSPEPKREDSKAIVDAIIGAARELLKTGRSFSTAELADRAGVGKASVYRYFADRNALLAEVFRREHHRYLERLDAELLPDTPVEEGVRICVQLLAGLKPGDENLRRTLNTALPLQWSMDEYDRMLETGMSRLEDWVTLRYPDESRREIRRRVFYSLAFVRGSVMLFLLRPSSSPENETMVEDLVSMVVRIVRGQLVPSLKGR